jgi:hypothetical protein
MARAEAAMTRRRLRQLVWVSVALCLVALALGVTEELLALVDPISQANCDRLTAGMPREQVEALLGGPGVPPSCGTGIPPGEDPEYWRGRGGLICVVFDSNGRVLRVDYSSMRSSGGPWLLDRLRAWLGR